MSSEWHDIDDPGFFSKKQDQNDSSKSDDVAVEAPPKTDTDEPEVKLIEATWQPGDKGYEFNKECYLEVKAEYLKKTSMRRVSAQLFVEFKGDTEDVSYQADGYLDEDGIARIKIILYYGTAYNDALQDDPQAACTYTCTVSHPSAEKEIQSEPLEMPMPQCVFYLDLRYFNPLKDGDERFCVMPGGITVRMLDHDTLSADDFQAEADTDGEGPVCLKIRKKDEEKPDLYFVLQTAKKYINLETNELVDSIENPSPFPFIALPEAIDSRTKTASDGRKGYLENYTGEGEGTEDAPWRFDLEDIKVFLSLKYYKDSADDFAPMPEGLCVSLYDKDTFSKDDLQAVACILKEGKTYLPVFAKDEDKPDLYFNIANPGGALYLDKEAGAYVKEADKEKPEQFVRLPEKWVSKDHKDTSGKEGIRADCPGDVETWDAPWEFVIVGGIVKMEWDPATAVASDDTDKPGMKTTLKVSTKGIPDDTEAIVEIFQYGKGVNPISIQKLTDFKVSQDKLVDKKGGEPEYRFPWHGSIYDYKRTQYYFQVSIGGILKSVKQEAATMLQLKHHDGVISNPDGSLAGTEGPWLIAYLGAQAPSIEAIADTVLKTGHEVESYSGTGEKVTVGLFKKLMARNLFLHHQDSHGMAYCTKHLLSNVWLEESKAVGADGVLEWYCPDCKNNTNAVGFICCAKGEYIEVGDVKSLDRAPKILMMTSCCLTAITNVYPKKWLEIGTRWYIGWAVPVRISNASNFSQAFYKRWMEFYTMDPNKVSDAFNDVKAPYLSDRPRIFGK